MNLNDIQPHHGRGWSFPAKFSKKDAELEMSEGVQDINESLYIIITTNFGERVMNTNFGCGVSNYIFDDLNTPTLALIEDNIRNSITLYEARVDLEEIEFDLNDGSGRLDIHITYKLRNENSRFNYVFPYYLKEANAQQ
jgi:uncharacterized protein